MLELKHELASKQRLIDKILIGLEQSIGTKQPAFDMGKVKYELTVALKSLAQRDVQITKLQANKKVKERRGPEGGKEQAAFGGDICQIGCMERGRPD